jgi:hypothetical protein
MACGNETQHHALYSSLKFEKNDVIHKKRQTSSRKFLVATDIFFANIFVTIVMDDEKYFSHSTLTGMDGFWKNDVENTLDAVKCKIVGKFEPKVLIWCAISEAGVSSSFSDVYITKCLPKMVKCGRIVESNGR